MTQLKSGIPTRIIFSVAQKNFSILSDYFPCRKKGKKYVEISEGVIFCDKVIREYIKDDYGNLIECASKWSFCAINSDGERLSNIEIEMSKNSINKVMDFFRNFIRLKDEKSMQEFILLTIYGAPEEKLVHHIGFHNSTYYFPNNDVNTSSSSTKAIAPPSLSKLRLYSIEDSYQPGELLKILNSNVTNIEALYILTAAAVMAPLSSTLEGIGIKPGIAIYLLAPSGSGKSTLASLFQSLYGDFKYFNLPFSFNSTVNGMTESIRCVDDVLLTIDDCHFQSEKAKEKLDQVIRLLSDDAGKQRALSMGGTNSKSHSNATLLITGELIPEVQFSTIARMLVLPFSKIDLNALNSLLKEFPMLRSEITAYIHYIESRLKNDQSNFLSELESFFAKYETILSGKISHPRLPRQCSSLALGIETLFNYYISSGTIQPEQLNKYREVFNTIIIGLADYQIKLQEQISPLSITFNLLERLVYDGVIGVSNRNSISSDTADIYDDDAVYQVKLERIYKKINNEAKKLGTPFFQTYLQFKRALMNDNILVSEKSIPVRIGNKVGKYHQINKVALEKHQFKIPIKPIDNITQFKPAA